LAFSPQLSSNYHLTFYYTSLSNEYVAQDAPMTRGKARGGGR
jgi:hypothetical protein